MNGISMLKRMASYNAWMNQRLFAVCADMGEEERKRNLGAFFRSIHGTLNHILLVDRLWLARIHGRPFTVSSLDQELFSDFEALAAARKETDGDIAFLTETVEADDLGRAISYHSLVSQTETVLPLSTIMLHMFMHQTHHRGQVTAMISRLGYEYGSTDITNLASMHTWKGKQAAS
ncbi:MAG TPA: DinB family protein [Methylophilaceae bacterium]|jgi:uncharacterized damage-inducible protein DinB